MKYLFLSLVLLGLSGGCQMSANSERNDQVKVQQQQAQYAVGQPVPIFDWSLERDVAIQLYQARNDRVVTWTVWRSDTGIIEGDCPSIGYPIPYDTSLTNPLQPMNGYSQGTAIEQAEPNGLFSSKNSIATWVRCIVDMNGNQVEAPVYIESKVTAYPYVVEIDYDQNRVHRASTAKPSVMIRDNRQ
ncbi:hypothetical protein A2239_02420 [Candidatus Uhrbacteria bacterium RIFOXYA2_FULL_40_9]|nr:MAG: hypothetical protein UT94_C0031G0022 [Candidatus Uhrbacteria bacterium GW2011_GWF2_40_263]OGL93920.1 MAG: hypothetical protein A2239_02420 [Candidatus Uhrbacteria bacterium RIFOXYA2_FULL_40_9]OGL97591.1 MAG: hypothetical protein A2332_01090 [Candidatus Uhrbacteria bacterium RIFOXYB2_FULL_41_18]HBK35257.1 hypothetical protein [Candidatus Uhrbacteria bacterium]HCB56110.1 hypothetical protein [Candidatus Uhrbacteria bacterium]